MTEPSAVEAEFYATPAWCVRRILEAVALVEGDWLDPCVGDGAIPNEVEEARSELWMVLDIRATRFLNTSRWNCHQRDYLQSKMPLGYFGRFDVCIMNPPFSKALQFAATALEHCDQVVMLQRLNWLASAERAEFLRANPPGVYVLPNRPSFTGDGKTDGADYAWYVWPPQHQTVRILDVTSKQERDQDARPPGSPRQQVLFG